VESEGLSYLFRNYVTVTTATGCFFKTCWNTTMDLTWKPFFVLLANQQ